MRRAGKTGVANALENEDCSDKKERFDYDGFWKDLIERFSYSLLERAVPELYEKADITKEVRLLDKEMFDIRALQKESGSAGNHHSRSSERGAVLLAFSFWYGKRLPL